MLNRNEFARHLGYADWSDLMNASRLVVEEGETATWYVTPLSDGRWAAWDTAELATDRVTYFATYEEALRDQYDAFLESIAEGRLKPEDWVGPDPASFGAPIRVYPLSYYEQKGGEYDDSGNGGERVNPEDFTFAVYADTDDPHYEIDDIVATLGGSRRDYWLDSTTGFWLRYRD